MKKFALLLMFLASATLLKADQVAVTVASSPPEGGATVPKSGATYQVEKSMELALTATAADLYDFDYWQIDGDAVFADGTKTSTASSATMIPSGQATVTAYFVRSIATSEIVVYDWLAKGRRFKGVGNGSFDLVKYPVYGWLVMSFDPSLNVFSGAKLITFWKEGKNKYWQLSSIAANIQVIPQADRVPRIYIRVFQNGNSQKEGDFISSGVMELTKRDVTGGTVDFLVAKMMKGYLTFYTKDSLDLQSYGSQYVELKFDSFRSQLGNVDNGGNLNSTVEDLGRRLNAKGFIQQF